MAERMHSSEYKFEHPTASILDSLNHEITVWCRNHNVKITSHVEYRDAGPTGRLAGQFDIDPHR